MSAKLSTHVLNLVTGRPGAGMAIELRRDGKSLKHTRTDGDGRALLLSESEMATGEYELLFHVGEYFDDRSFLDQVPIRFHLHDPTVSYHVPLLCTPCAYSTYRGS